MDKETINLLRRKRRQEMIVVGNLVDNLERIHLRRGKTISMLSQHIPYQNTEASIRTIFEAVGNYMQQAYAILAKDKGEKK